MDIAALVCNKKVNYDLAFQTFSMYEYLKSKGNQIQIIDYNLLENKRNKKNEIIYKFLSNNTILTLNRYESLDQVEEKIPLADKYIIVNGNYDELNVKIGEKNIAYGIRDISTSELDLLKENYSKMSTSFKIKNKDVPMVADPIFLLSKEEWYDEISEKSSIDVSENYVLVYSEVVTKDMLNYANKIAEKSNLKVYIVADKIDTPFYKGKRLRNVVPMDLANLISDATDVVTSCDDGIKMSVMFERNLHIFTTQDTEQIELIDKLEMNNRIVKNSDTILTSVKDYEKSKNTIDELKNNSYEFLKI